MNLAIDIAIETEGWNDIDDIATLVHRAAGAALNASGTHLDSEMADIETEVSLVLCDDAFIRELNAKWRGQDKPTNVLSFPSGHDGFAPTLGDIVIAYETVSREAREEGKTLADHLTHMIVHGILHLLGFDHEDDEEAEEMEAIEIEALKSLGIASPYHEPADDRRILQ